MDQQMIITCLWLIAPAVLIYRVLFYWRVRWKARRELREIDAVTQEMIDRHLRGEPPLPMPESDEVTVWAPGEPGVWWGKKVKKSSAPPGS